GIPGCPVAIAVVIEVAAILAAVEVYAGVAPVVDCLDPAITQAVDGLFQSPAKITSPTALAPRQRTVGAAVGQVGAGPLPGHSLGLIGHHQHRAVLVALIVDGDYPTDCGASLFQPNVAVVTVGDQLHQRLLHRGKSARVDIDNPLVHRNCRNAHS